MKMEVRTILHVLLVFLTLLSNVACQEASLTFVIDTTHSMHKDIEDVRGNVNSVMDIVLDEKSSQIGDIVLITFNDPDKPILQTRTRDRTELKRALEKLPVDGGDDCPEMSLSGVKLALESSLPGSYIYVFTDASAKDYHMSDEIQQLCQQKQSQIVFVLTGNCKLTHLPDFQVYYHIATASSGVVIRIPQFKVEEVLNKFVKEDIKGNKTDLAAQLIPPKDKTTVAFWIDELTTSAMVSASGMQVHFKHTKGPSPHINTVIWEKNFKVTLYENPKPGEYMVLVKGGSSYTSIVVTGRSDFYFRHGFSVLQPKSLDDTALQPILNNNTHLSLLVSDPDCSVRVNSAHILDMKGNVIMDLPLKELWPNFYITEPFVVPNCTFKLTLTGEVIRSGNPITRIAKIPITPQKLPRDTPDSQAPVVKIMEGGSVEVARGAAVTLTCKVSAYPEPEITWTNDKGITVQSNSSIVQIPYEYISYLNIPSASEARYYCQARNSFDNKQYNKAVDVIIKDPLIVQSVPNGTTKIAYKTESTLACDVRSQQPLLIRWYHVSKATGEYEHVISSKNYSISSDGKQLKILSMDSDLVGKYECKVYLQKDPTQNREFSTNVEITGFAPPKIDDKIKTVHVAEHKSATIICEITEGVPKPTISWQMKAAGSSEYRSFAGSGSELRIKQAALADGGHYKCVAENVAGYREAVVAELVVLKTPAVTIVNGSNMDVPYGSPLTLACRVIASPEPTVVWKDGAGNTIPATRVAATSVFDNTHTITLANVMVSQEYSCSAKNDQGSTTENIQVLVSSPFIIHSLPPASISARYGTVVNLKCDITSTLPMEIRWYRIEGSTSEKKEIESSDQYTILSNGAELKINEMDVGLEGDYVCRASLLADPDEHVENATQVEIEGLAPPKIDDKIKTVHVAEHKSATIICEITEGVPKPTISWQMKAAGSSEYRSFAGSGSELRIKQAALADGGHYKCVAENVAGHREAVVAELVVLKTPAVTIVNGTNMDVPYGSPLTLACRVIASPEPTVVWKDGAGNTIPATRVAATSVFDNTHTITLANVMVSQEYSCSAKNDQGSTTENIQVLVSSPFIIHSLPPASISARYGTVVNLKCDITSTLPMEIRWYRIEGSTSEKKEIESSDQYTILSNGAELKINEMDVGLEGDYVCRASLLADPDEHVENATQVEIEGLAPPKIDDKIKTVHVAEHKSATIICEITEGVPKPTISWQMKAAGSSEYRSFAGSGSELRIKQAALADGGHYKCVAENVAGHREAVVAELVVLKTPAVTIVNGTNMDVPYGSPLTLACRVIASPEPTVVWKDGAGNTIPATRVAATSVFDNTHTITLANVMVSQEYSCSAKNDQGSTTENIQVLVSSPFIIHSLPPASISARYGTVVNLKCDITSTLPMEIRWYRIEGSTSEKKEIESSDQYTILSNGAELKINEMDVGLEGDYVCRASLLADPDEHVENATQVEIEGLAPPKIDDKIKTVHVAEHKSATIICEITEGVPKPTISWQMKAAGSSEYRSFAGSGSELRIKQAALADGGHYKCVAENVAGHREAVVAELVVLKTPAVTIVNGTNMDVPYGSPLTLACRVIASPEPTVVWKDGAGNTIPATRVAATSVFDNTHTIALANVMVSQEYSCSAKNDQGSTTENIQVLVSSPFIIHSLPPASISARYGTVVNLKCDITSTLPMEIRWYRIEGSTSEKKEIESSDQYTILSNGAELKINEMDVGLEGKYACRASLLADPDEHVENATQVEIEGLEAPEITGDAEQTVRVGELVSIKCNVVKGVPKPELSWQFKSTQNGEFVDIANTGNEWHTANVTAEHSGYYKCIATNNQGTDEHVVQLIVQVPARITTKESVYTGVVGDLALKVPCDTIGYPKPVVRWDVNGSAVTLGNKYAIEDGALIIKDPTQSDGNYSYTCTATNMLGSDTKQFQVKVDSTLNDYGICHDMNVLENRSIQLTCSLPRAKSSTLKWFINGVDMAYSHLHMSVKNATVAISGNYSCHVSDVHGSATETYVLHVGFPPMFKPPLPEPTVLWDGGKKDDDVLRCDFEAQPEPSVKWFFNGKPLVGKSSHDLNFFEFGAGHYECKINNLHGEVKREFDVKYLPPKAVK